MVLSIRDYAHGDMNVVGSGSVPATNVGLLLNSRPSELIPNKISLKVVRRPSRTLLFLQHFLNFSSTLQQRTWPMEEFG